MSAALDPIVARALDQLVPAIETDPEVLLERARVEAQELERRRAKRFRRTVVLAFAALLLFASAAVAASRFDLFSWLDQSNRSSASFSIDNSRTYRGSAPEFLICPKAGARPFTCSLVGYYPTSNRRAYFLSGRVEAQPHASREFYLRSLASFERNGSVDQAKAERFRHDLAAVGDDFLAALNVLGGGMTISGGATITEGQPLHVRQGYELVPPAGVPMFIACESDGNGARCHNLASSREVPVGTPYYFLQSSPTGSRSHASPRSRPMSTASSMSFSAGT